MISGSGFSLHHVGYAVKEIGAVAENYIFRFGYVAATGVIHDPLQTALVQFLKLAGDSAYLELVAPDNDASKLAASVARRGSLHHLCYACGPLEEVLPVLQASGMLLFSEPKVAVAFAGRRVCWLVGQDSILIELVERRSVDDACVPGVLA